MKTLERLVAEKLLKIKAVKLQPANPFTWASGWKSPIYNDNRKTLSYPAVRNFIKLELARVVSEKFDNKRKNAAHPCQKMACRDLGRVPCNPKRALGAVLKKL